MTLNLISSRNPATIASNIASNYKEASPDKQVDVLIATGLVLFAFTFAVNFLARWVVDPQREERMAHDDARLRRTAPTAERRSGSRSPRLPGMGTRAWSALVVGRRRRARLAARLAPRSRGRPGRRSLLFVVALPLWSAVVEGRRARRGPAGRPSLIWTRLRRRPRCR